MPGPVRYFRVVVRLWLKLLYHVFPCTSKRAHSFLLSSNECSRILTYHSNVGYRYVRCYEPQSRSPQGKIIRLCVMCIPSQARHTPLPGTASSSLPLRRLGTCRLPRHHSIRDRKSKSRTLPLIASHDDAFFLST